MANAIQTTQSPPIDPQARALAQRMTTVKSLCERAKGDLAQALPKHMTVDRLLKVFYAAVSRTPGLLECSPLSLLMALMQASETGLEPNTPLQHAYLIPRKNKNTRQKEAHFMPSYRGLVHLAMQSGKVRSLEAVPVYQRDHYVNKRTLIGRVFEHEQFIPNVLTDERGNYQDEPAGPLRLVYSIAQLVDADPSVEIMTRDQIEKIRGRSQSSDDGPWVTDFDEMARKTVLRRHCKHLPASTERHDGKASQADRLAGALEIQGAHEEGRSAASIATGEMTSRLLEEAAQIPGVVEPEEEKVAVQVPATAPVEAKGPASAAVAPAAEPVPAADATPAKPTTKRAQALLDKVTKPSPQASPPAVEPPKFAKAPWDGLGEGERYVDAQGQTFEMVRTGLGIVPRLMAAEADSPPPDDLHDSRQPGEDGE